MTPVDDLRRPVPRRLKVTFHDVDGRSASVEADMLAWIESMPDAEFMGLESIVAHQAQVRGLSAAESQREALLRLVLFGEESQTLHERDRGEWYRQLRRLVERGRAALKEQPR